MPLSPASCALRRHQRRPTQLADWLDPLQVWSNTTVQLMTGSNFAMVPIATVITNLDGTTGSGVLEWTCPDVSPNSEIYLSVVTLPLAVSVD